MSYPSPFRGTRKKGRSMRNRRLTWPEKVARFNECKHTRFRYRTRGTEAVCLDCEAVQKLKGNNVLAIEVVEGWKLQEPTVDDE